MVISFATLIVLGILLFGVIGAYRGLRAAALTLGAIFFGLVVVIFSGDVLVAVFRRLGVPIETANARALFDILVFAFAVTMGAAVLRRMIGITSEELSRGDRGWGFILGLINGFLIMAVVEHFIADAAAADNGGASVNVGIPSFIIAHPTPSEWTFTLTTTGFTFLPGGGSADLWAKLPTALLLLLLFLGFVFVGTVYGRLSRSR